MVAVRCHATGARLAQTRGKEDNTDKRNVREREVGEVTIASVSETVHRPWEGEDSERGQEENSAVCGEPVLWMREATQTGATATPAPRGTAPLRLQNDRSPCSGLLN